MLITDNSGGKSDGKERDQLQAMIAVGSEFITYNDAESTVQKSGEFVRIDRIGGESAKRFLLMHETAQAFDDTGKALTGNELRTLSPSVKLSKRARLYISERDQESGELPFAEISSFKASSRIPRFKGYSRDSQPRQFESVPEANYTAQAGKRRLFSSGDGKVLMIREVTLPGDSRYFNDSRRTPVGGITKDRGLRAARVELVELNTVSGSTSDAVFSFDVFSGVGFDPANKLFSDSIRPTTAMYDDDYVYAAFSGVNFGSSLDTPTTANVPVGGDASDTYAVSEPAIAKTVNGRQYRSIVAVYPTPEDVYDSRSSGPYRLTCKRTTPDGVTAVTKINFPTLPSRPLHYLAARGMSLHRLTTNRIALRVNVHVMQFGAGGTLFPVSSDAIFFWSQDNGATWTYNPVTAGFPGVFPYGGMLVKEKETLLAFSWNNPSGTSSGTQVHRITSAGTAQISTIPGDVFSEGLLKKSGSHYLVPYVPIGFGGVVYKVGTDKKKKRRLWMQFDPHYNYKSTETFVLDYPGSRPMLLTSDDGGLTWQRKLLPTKWAFLAGFVVSISETMLAVPVFTARKSAADSVKTTVYTSKDGGDTWAASSAKITLPAKAWVDGSIVIGDEFIQGATVKQAQDVVDSVRQYNRGELLPMVVLSDMDGRVAPANPARPWMVDYRFKEPDYG